MQKVLAAVIKNCKTNNFWTELGQIWCVILGCPYQLTHKNQRLIQSILTKLPSLYTIRIMRFRFLKQHNFCVMAFFPVEETTVASKVLKETSKILSRHNVAFVDNDCAMLVTTLFLNWSNGKGQSHENWSDKIKCLTSFVRVTLLNSRSNVDGSLFCQLDKSPLTRYQFS